MSLTWSTLRGALARAGVDVSEGTVAGLRAFWALLEDAGRRTNLTRIQGAGAFMERHAFDALLGLPHLDATPDGAWIDVGSGGGVPGIVLALARPERAIVLVESVGKKAEFLARAARSLDLGRVEVRCARAEDAAHDPGLRGGCAAAVARALSGVPTCLELTLPFVAVGGKVVLYRGPNDDESGAAVAGQLGGLAPVWHDACLPSGIGRRFLVVPKGSETPSAYPRRTGVPAKRPLQA